jgi:site-specific DNA recombinase
MSSSVKKLRCAIYTQVSTDAGLDQEFNSLDAQREAAEAFIKSQAHEGWQPIRKVYDDRGFSGGSLQRPALQQLLTDVRSSLIDVILVYKVDRLTRSLADFAKLVELFDAHNVSFVSVTQAFNTTNSMGRLTLNVLLSFAQFEREVTAERIRDKITASKKNGIWMGGTVPLGYRVENRKLHVIDEEAATVRSIFQQYLELGSVVSLLQYLRQQGIRTKQRMASGTKVGGIPFTAGPLLYLLKNRIYIGEIVHRGQAYAGDHAPILDRDLFEAVRARLCANQVAQDRRNGHSRAVLMGKIVDDRGNVMTPRHTQKGTRRYYYYTSRAFIEGRKDEAGSISRVASNDIEPKIASALIETIKRYPVEGEHREYKNERALLDAFVAKVTVGKDVLEISLQGELGERYPSLSVPWKRRTGRPKREIIFRSDNGGDLPQKARNRRLLIRSIAAGRARLAELVSGKAASIEAIAQREKRSVRSVNMIVGLAFLAPDIVAAAVAGKLPRGLGLMRLCTLSPIWAEQRKSLTQAV